MFSNNLNTVVFEYEKKERGSKSDKEGNIDKRERERVVFEYGKKKETASNREGNIDMRKREREREREREIERKTRKIKERQLMLR